VRLFLAAELDDAARKQCGALLERVRHSLGEATSAVKWTAAGNIHITLHFLGDVDRAGTDRLTAALGLSLPQPTFRAETTHLGAFTHGGPPKVVWLAIGPGAD
jgi:2'-5' RNA ligase